MNIFYQVPEKIYERQLDEYYAARKYIILLYDYMNWENAKHTKFINNLAMNRLKSYYNITNFPHEKQFTKNAATWAEDYAKNKEAYYTSFWNYDGNYKLLSDFVRPTNLVNPEKIIEYMRKFQSNIKYDKIMLINMERKPITLKTAIETCEKELDVTIRQTWTWFALIGYKKFHIYEKNKHIGSFYFKYSFVPMTIPLGFKLSLVKAPLTHQLTHEIVHAVQYCFTRFYNYSKSFVEIPAMMIEKKYCVCPQGFIDRNIALAIADFESTNPYEFDYIFNLEAKTTITHKISNRFWHYIHYPNQYYSYVMGLIMPFGNVKEMVRDPQITKDTVDRVIQESLNEQK